MADLKHNLKFVHSIAPISPAATGVITGAIVDTEGFESKLITLHNGAVSTANFSITPTVYEGATTGSMTAVADADLIGTEAAAAISGATSDGEITTIGYRGNKRYLRVDATVLNAATGVHAATVVLANPRKAPVTQ